MIAKDPEIIYIDTDVYSVKPLPGGESHVYGYEFWSEEKQKGQINGAILRLPQDSPALNGLLEFTKDEYPVPEWLPPRFLNEIKARAEAGDPMHVSEMPWGRVGAAGRDRVPSGDGRGSARAADRLLLSGAFRQSSRLCQAADGGEAEADREHPLYSYLGADQAVLCTPP